MAKEHTPQTLGLWTQQQTAKQLGVSVETLGKGRSKQKGPAYIRVGNLIRYRQTDVEQWLRMNTVVVKGKH
jgi:predicted DNA-binding transcriptional regulator AlpA